MFAICNTQEDEADELEREEMRYKAMAEDARRRREDCEGKLEELRGIEKRMVEEAHASR